MTSPAGRALRLLTPRKAAFLAGVAIAGYFLYHARFSLRAEFTHDDLMNCWRGVFSPLTALIGDCITFFRFSDSYRPFPALVYRAAFNVSGFDLFPLRVLLLAVMGLNTLLLYGFARRLAGSREVGVLVALLGAHHFNIGIYYFNTGFVYDIFCLTFFLGALVFYLRIRQDGRLLRWQELAAFCALYVLALDSKELAVSLPVVVAAWELLFHPPPARARALLRWQYRELLPAWITGVATAAYIGGRVLAKGGMSEIGGYKITLSAAEYLKNTGHILNELFFLQDFFDITRTLAFLLALIAVAALWRSRTLLLCWVLLVVGLLPVAFIPQRGLAAAWLPVAGLLVFAAAAAVWLRDALLTALRRAAWRPAGQVVLFALAYLLILKAQPGLRSALEGWQPEYGSIRETRESFAELAPAMPPKSTVLIVTDPFGDSFSTALLIHLLYRDSSIIINQLFRFDKPPPRADWAGYDFIFDVAGGKVVRLNPADFASPDSR